MEPLLEVRQLGKTYGRGKKRKTTALDGVTFSIFRGTCLGVVGESGCGKSTLCRMITGLERPTSGQILYGGNAPFHFSGGNSVGQKRPRGQIQMVFQNSLDAVNLHINVCDIISEPLVNFFHMNRGNRLTEVGRLLELVGLSPEDMWKYPRQFSGGQLQRICIARALAAKPELLLLDEPLSSLDLSVQAQLLNLLSDLKGSLNLTCLLISHDLEAVYYLSDAILVMYGGCVMEQIDRINEFGSLCHPYTRRLLAAHGVSGQERIPVTGEEWEASGCPFAPRCAKADELCRKKRPSLQEIGDGHRAACHYLY